MGDRGNIYMKNPDGDDGTKRGVYLYSHWGGSGLPLIVKAALAKKWRWTDDSYLTRIIFDEMTEEQQGQETGYGIATYRPDNEHPVIVVDCETQMVGYAREDKEPSCFTQWTFEKFITLDDETLTGLFNK